MAGYYLLMEQEKREREGEREKKRERDVTMTTDLPYVTPPKTTHT